MCTVYFKVILFSFSLLFTVLTVLFISSLSFVLWVFLDYWLSDSTFCLVLSNSIACFTWTLCGCCWVLTWTLCRGGFGLICLLCLAPIPLTVFHVVFQVLLWFCVSFWLGSLLYLYHFLLIALILWFLVWLICMFFIFMSIRRRATSAAAGRKAVLLQSIRGRSLRACPAESCCHTGPTEQRPWCGPNSHPAKRYFFFY